MLYATLVPSCMSTHSRCCAKESGYTPGGYDAGSGATVRGRGTASRSGADGGADVETPVPADADDAAGRVPGSEAVSIRSSVTGAGGTAAALACSSPSTCEAMVLSVGDWKMARRGSSTPSASRTRPIRRVASSECPPSAKKSSSERAGALSSSAQISARTISVGERGAAAGATGALVSVSGRARRSTLPLGVTGSAGRNTHADGTMYSGTCPLRYARNASEAGTSPSATTYATSRRSSPSPRATTTVSRTEAYARSAASISPGSMRKPRIFTCWSARPAISATPSGR